MLLIKDVFCALNAYHASVFGLFFPSTCSGSLFYTNVYVQCTGIFIDVLYTEPLQTEETVFYTSNNTASLFMPSEVEMIMYCHAVN